MRYMRRMLLVIILMSPWCGGAIAQSTTTYKGITVQDPAPTGAAGLRYDNNFKALADRVPGASYIKTTDPTVDDDVDLGYYPGYIWVNVNGPLWWGCTDNTDGAANWEQLNAAGDSAYISDAVYGSGWDGVTTIAPSKNTLYDLLSTYGTMATQDADAVAITGGSASGLTSLGIDITPTEALHLESAVATGEFYGMKIRDTAQVQKAEAYIGVQDVGDFPLAGIWLGETMVPDFENYSLLYSASGILFGSPAGQSMYFRIGNVDKMIVRSGGNLEMPNDSAYLLLGAGLDYGIAWDGTNAVHSIPSGKFDFNGPLQISPGASVDPSNNGDMVFELTSDTVLAVKAKGSDATVRAVTIPLTDSTALMATDVGIADNNLLEVDDADNLAVDDYAKVTASGIVGRTYAQVKSDLQIAQAAGTIDADGTDDIDWSSNHFWIVTVDINEVLTFTDPPAAGESLRMVAIQSGGSNTLDVASATETIYWPDTDSDGDGDVPTFPATAGQRMAYTFLFDGTNYYATGIPYGTP